MTNPKPIVGRDIMDDKKHSRVAIAIMVDS
jgi:hypothetical protein